METDHMQFSITPNALLSEVTNPSKLISVQFTFSIVDF
jgi:hypothetical protein